jgi:pilus assembly protein CpaB
MKSLILIFIALGCGLVASIGISQVMQSSGSSTPGMEMEQILVALSDIDIGAKLDAKNVKLEDWPKTKIPEGSIRRLEEVKDKFAHNRFFKGEPILITKLADTANSVTDIIPPGYRAMPVKVSEDTVMKAIAPGDRVDVMVFLKADGNEITRTGAFTILRNVRIFAVNTNTERSVDSKGQAENFRTVSLLVKEAHAGELIVAAHMGKINLTLRRQDEKDDQANVEEVTPLEEILHGKGHISSDPGPSPGSRPAPLLESFQNAKSGPPAGPLTVAKVEWKMQIFGPADVKQYEWLQRDALPVESTLLNSGTSTSGSGPAPATNTVGPTEPTRPSEGDTTKSDEPAVEDSAPPAPQD